MLSNALNISKLMKLLLILLITSMVAAASTQDSCFYNCTYSNIKCDVNSTGSVNCYPEVAYNFIMQSCCAPIKGLVLAGKEIYTC